MKHHILSIVFIFSLSAVYSQGIEFETGTWKSILAKAKQENKLVFVDCTTVWCKPCKWMEANVFTESKVGKFYNENFITIQVDMEKGEGIELRKQYKVNSYPTYLFVDSKGNLIHRDGGAKNADLFIAVGKKALDPASNLVGMNAEYEAGNRSQDFLRVYIPVLGKAKQKEKQAKVFESYYKSVSKTDLLNEKDYDVIMSVVEPGDEAFFFVLKNHEKFKEIVGEQKFNSRIYAKFIVPFSQLIFKNKVDEMKKEAEKYKPYYPYAVQKAEDMAMVRWYREQKLTEPLSKACVAYIQTYSPNDPGDIFYCMDMILKGKDMDQDKYAETLELTENAVRKFSNNYSLRDVYAGLLYKSGRKEDAIKEARKAVELAPADKQGSLWSKNFLEELIRL